MRLKDLGFPAPKSVSKLSLDWDMDTVPTFDYSIGELIEMLPESVNWTPRIIRGNIIEYSFETEGSELFYCNQNNELIDNLFDMAVKLKEEGKI